VDCPPLVRQALEAARRLGFPVTRAEAGDQPSCAHPEVGRAMFAAGIEGGVIGEIGTGTGFSTAWMVDAMSATTRLVTVEYDGERARAAAAIFAADPRVEVLHGDANQVIPAHAPFDLLFADGGWREPGALPDLLEPGGRLIVDDVTPVAALPADSPYRRHDPKRELFFNDDRLVSAEIVLPDLRSSVLVGTRRTAR
jgi:predicted O-methyltransferase YrrM